MNIVICVESAVRGASTSAAVWRGNQTGHNTSALTECKTKPAHALLP